MLKKYIQFVIINSLALLLSTYALAKEGPQRVISLGGTVTEIIYALGEEQRLIANDLSSIYPPEATRLPRIGYYRNLSIEGVVSLAPDLILASEQAGPGHILEKIENLGIPIKRISDHSSLDSIYEASNQIAEALDVPSKGKALELKIREQMGKVLDENNNTQSKPLKALFLMKHTNQAMVAGKNTSVDLLMQLAGLRNVATHENYRNLSTEGMIALQPELIITTTNSVDSKRDIQKFVKQTGLTLTPAAQKNKIIVIDDLLILGLGPRTPKAIEKLIEVSQ